MLIAIDHGNYAIKTPHHSFVSGLSEHTVKPPMADEILEYDGRYWTPSGKRLSYMRDKTQDERYFILTLFAIAKELEDTGRYSPVEQIQLAVGLPPEHYGVLKDKFARYFKRDGIIKFVYKDKPYSIMIDKVMVFPQAYAAVVPKSSMVVNMLRVFVVDIGGYTTDVLLLKNGKPDLQFCRSLETGIITMNNEIIRKVGALHDMRIEDEHISAVLSGQDTILPDDVKQTICGATKLHAQDILNQLRELQVDLRSNPAVFIGGGSLLLRPFLEASPLVAKADFVESPNANALGYEMLGRVQLSHRPAQRTVWAVRKDGKYRFTLQFSADNEDQIRVGELLENLGNRKSTVIISALSDYIDTHPELQSGYSKIEVKVAPAFDRSQMERLIRSIVEEKLSELHTTETIADTSMSGTSEALEEDITKMLDNLDMFN